MNFRLSIWKRKLGFTMFRIMDLGFWSLEVEMKVFRSRNELDVVGKGWLILFIYLFLWWWGVMNEIKWRGRGKSFLKIRSREVGKRKSEMTRGRKS